MLKYCNYLILNTTRVSVRAFSHEPELKIDWPPYLAKCALQPTFGVYLLKDEINDSTLV